MKPNELYIIGNGFDIYHGLKSRFIDFKNYLQTYNNDMLELIENYFDNDKLWSDFEETLSTLDSDQIIENCIDYIVDYSSVNWSDSDNHVYQQEVERLINYLTIDLKKIFTEWVLQLKLHQDLEVKKIKIEKNSVFLNFNYTDTLEKVYCIPNDRIVYIHNKAIDKNSNLIIGHNRNPNSRNVLKNNCIKGDSDFRIEEGNQIIDSYYLKTYKSSNKLIKQHKTFFSSLSEIKNIYVLGHSIKDVDLAYFKEIVKQINSNIVTWKISAHSKADLYKHKKSLFNLGIRKDLCEFKEISRLNTDQLELVFK